MNKRTILHILGWVLLFEGAAMQLSTFVGLWYHEDNFKYFLFIGLGTMALGALIMINKPKKVAMSRRDGFAATALSWIVLSVVGALPFWMSGQIPNWIDAVFESISGFTTTGSTILVDIEALDNCMLFWRALSHFLGGMGVIVFLLALIPKLGGNAGINLMKAESTGPEVEKTMPKLRNYAFVLYAIYVGLTVLEVILLMCGGLYFFDAVTTSFATAGTGGFACYNNSIAYFDSYYIQGVISVFMMLFGVNFYVYILILTRKFKSILKLEELWYYLGIVVLATIAIAVNISRIYPDAFESFHHSFFYVTSILSSTGFAIEDTNKWPAFSQTLVVVLTCIGACAGSTGGGFKVSRVVILAKEVRKEFMLIVHPRTVQTIKMNGKKVSHEVTRNVSVYLMIYILFIIVSTAIVSLNGFDFTTNITAAITTLNNTGPGFSIVGSAGNYSGFNILSKIVFCFNMIAGRLELYPLLIIFMPRAWRKS
ncbi:MAG: TrkH family potassium uptake protein [Ruminococcus sp.]|nr:TrkH family potassium uptake protein [Ruminococcus sp.]